jgi:hypothetical protein
MREEGRNTPETPYGLGRGKVRAAAPGRLRCGGGPLVYGFDSPSRIRYSAEIPERD